MKMMTNVMLLLAMIAIPSMAKIMVLDDATDLRALLSGEGLPTEHKMVDYALSKSLSQPDVTRNVDPKLATGRLGSQLLWSVMCLDTPFGNVPCRMDGSGNGYFSYFKNEYQWKKLSEPVTGRLYEKYEDLPADCRTRGKKYNETSNDYFTIAFILDNKIPGRSTDGGKSAWYAINGVEKRIFQSFKILC